MPPPADARLGPPGPIEAMAPRRHRVVDRVDETDDTATLLVEPVDGPPAAFRPGQFHMLWAFGVGEVPISISGADGADGPLAHTIRAVGPVTRALCAAAPGTEIGLRGPFGTDWGLDAAQGGDVLLVAGGIGLAPLRSALHRVLAERDRFGRVGLLVGARSPDAILFTRELENWRGRFDTEVEVTVDYAVAGWRGDVGVVTQLIRRAVFDPDRTLALVCGPEVMMRFTAKALVDRGVPTDRIRVSLERNMQCAIGLCGHCQLGPDFVCRDGPVLSWARVGPMLGVRER